MGQIETIIKEYFDKMAMTVFLLNYPFDKLKGCCDTDYSVKAMEVQLSIGNPKSMQGLAYEMLDEIDTTLSGLDKKNDYIKYSEFYKDAEEIEFDDIDIPAIADKHIKDGIFLTTDILAEISSLLIGNIGKEIIRLYYYKKYHRWYEEDLKKAFDECVDLYAINSNCSSYTMALMLDGQYDTMQEALKEIFSILADNTYSAVFGHPDLIESYKPKYEDFQERLEQNSSSAFLTGKIELRKRINKYILPNNYHREAENRLIREQYLNITDCYKHSPEQKQAQGQQQKPKTTYDNYLTFWERTFIVIAGYDYDYIKENYFYEKPPILYTMENSFIKNMTECIKLWRRMGHSITENYQGSNFNKSHNISYNDIKLINSISKLCTQIILSHNPRNNNVPIAKKRIEGQRKCKFSLTL